MRRPTHWSLWTNETGSALTLMVVVVFAVSALGLAMHLRVESALSSQASSKFQSDLVLLSDMLKNSIDCGATFSNAGINPQSPGTSCPSSSAKGGQTGPYFKLYRSVNGVAKVLGNYDATNGYTEIGSWALRASCSSTDKTIVVRAARMKSDVIQKDPLTGRLQDWDSSKASLLAGGPSSGGLSSCALSFAPPSAFVCPGSEVAIGFDQVAMKPVCGPVGSTLPKMTCAAGQAIEKVNLSTGSFSCQAIEDPAAFCTGGLAALSWNPGSRRCVLKAQDFYGGSFTTGCTKHPAGCPPKPEECTQANPQTGACNCGPGYATLTSSGFANDPKGKTKFHNVQNICIRI